MLGHLVENAHGKCGGDKGEVDHHVPEQFVVVDLFGIHKDLQQVDGGDGHDGCRHLVLEAGGVQLAQPVELVVTLVQVDLGDKVFIAGKHHHYDQPPHQGD